MELNYAILRVEPIMTIPDLAQIGSHNKREKKAYQSNPNIKLELTKNNIELVPLDVKYVKGFDELTKEYKKEHDERMKTERADRKKRYHEMLNSSKNVVADELVMTASYNFFKDMSREQIKDWADTCMEFVYNDLGYKKEQILHATVHLDEETPHIHCVVVPLVKKLDKRTNTERYTISKKQYIKDKIQLSHLQDLYHKRLTERGYDLERGIKGSDNKHIKIKEYKQLTKKLNHELNVKNDRFDKAMNDFEEKMKTTKQTLIIDKDFVKVKKDTFESMNNVISESKKVMELQPKLQTIFNEVDSYANSYKSLEKENQKYKKEVSKLETENKELKDENRSLIYRLNELFQILKKFLRKLLQRGNDYTKDETALVVKDCYDSSEFDMGDVIKISKGTTKQDELFEYVEAPDYYKERVRDYDEDEYDKDDFDLSR
ncbi:MAG: plasmid recombination protein [Bacilli bacterium]|nr:plasmid recombination protein [Bacilli bacterium]